ncbi:MAG: 30S ribosomal protein S17 [Bacilli bacterium]
MKENNKRELIGKVVSDKGDKTIIFAVETYKTDPKYKKRVKYSKKYTAHDENNQAKVGDVVKVVETKPISKTKRFSLVEIVKEAVIL